MQNYVDSKFDYKGYSAEYLEEICREDFGSTGSVPWKYWTSELYSSGFYLRKYGYYPSFFPLYCYSMHGVNVQPVSPHEVDNDAAFFLCYNDDKVKEYKQLSNKPCFKIPAPLPWLRKNYHLNKSTNAQGTLAFFQHTTPAIGFYEEVSTVVNRYIDELLALPVNLHPICVCLHMHDVRNGTYKIFLERGVPVYSAGNTSNEMFFKYFYDILLNFKCSTSSSMGSNAYYSIEANVPFFLFGKEALCFNAGDKNIKKGIYGDVKSQELISVESEFKQFSYEVTKRQRDKIEFYLGNRDNTSRFYMSMLLYISFFKNTTMNDYKGYLLLATKSLLKKILPPKIYANIKNKFIQSKNIK